MHYELLPIGQTVHVDLSFLTVLVVMEKMRSLSGKTASLVPALLLHGNVTPNTTNVAQATLNILGFQVWLHPPLTPEFYSLVANISS